MNSSAFEKVLLSSILTSCAVFSVLMVAFIPRRAEPITIDAVDRISSVEEINHRDVVIRHIGMSIVVSVGAGITTAEMIRKWGRSREAALEGQQFLGAQTMLPALAAPDFSPSDFAPSDFALSNQSHHSFSASLPSFAVGSGVQEPQREGQQHSVSVLERDRDGAFEQAALPLFLFQPLMQPATDEVDWFLAAPAESALPLPLTNVTAIDQPALAIQVLASREQYQTCRIALSGTAENVLVILFEGQYYQFVRVAGNHEQALNIATRLNQRGETTVVTHSEARYVVWTLVQDAYLQAAA